MIVEGFLIGCIFTGALNLGVYNYYNNKHNREDEKIIMKMVALESIKQKNGTRNDR